jgi:type I restriction enzyme S subunit
MREGKSKTEGLRRFKVYPQCKESGVKWIPSHWDVVRSKRLFALRNAKAHPTDRQLTASQAYGVILQDEFVALEGRRVVEVVTGAEILKHVERGDFVISMRSFQGGIEWSKSAGAISSAYVVLAPSVRVDPRFFYFLLKSRPYLQALPSTTNLVRDGQALRYENFSLVDLPLLSLGEQQTIATYLARRTERIDALIAKKERLIELLQERRTALITRAVTKGLDPNVPMKDSRVEWLGDVPAHWAMTKMWDVSRATSGATPTRENRDFWDGGIPWVSAKDMKRRLIDSSEDTVSEAALSQTGLKLIPPSAVLVVVRGMILAHTLPVALNTVRVTINQDMKALRLDGRISPQYFAYWLEGVGPEVLAVLVEEAAHGTKAIRIDRWRVLPVQVPPIAEQISIVKHVEEMTAKLDSLSVLVQDAIDRLREFRTALISAAVTGKIDVRREVT